MIRKIVWGGAGTVFIRGKRVYGYTVYSLNTSKCSALWGRSSRHVTVGLCTDDVEIGLATHLRYIRPCTRTDRIATRVTKGGAPPQ